jgi:hypothetical protein
VPGPGAGPGPVKYPELLAIVQVSDHEIKWGYAVRLCQFSHPGASVGARQVVTALLRQPFQSRAALAADDLAL